MHTLCSMLRCLLHFTIRYKKLVVKAYRLQKLVTFTRLIINSSCKLIKMHLFCENGCGFFHFLFVIRAEQVSIRYKGIFLRNGYYYTSIVGRLGRLTCWEIVRCKKRSRIEKLRRANSTVYFKNKKNLASDKQGLLFFNYLQ